MTQLGSYAPTVPLDADGRVCASAPCLSCGYDVRTQPADGVCPECAYPVRLSIGGQLLRYAAPRWVRQLARGVLLLIIAAAAAVGGGILLQMVTLLTLGLTAPSGPPTSSFIMLPALGQFLLGVAILGVCLLILIGRGLQMYQFVRRQAAISSLAILPVSLVGAALFDGLVASSTLYPSSIAMMMAMGIGLIDRLPQLAIFEKRRVLRMVLYENARRRLLAAGGLAGPATAR